MKSFRCQQFLQVLRIISNLYCLFCINEFSSLCHPCLEITSGNSCWNTLLSCDKFSAWQLRRCNLEDLFFQGNSYMTKIPFFFLSIPSLVTCHNKLKLWLQLCSISNLKGKILGLLILSKFFGEILSKFFNSFITIHLNCNVPAAVVAPQRKPWITKENE